MLGIMGDLVEDVVVWMAEPVQHGTDTDVQIFRTRGGSGANVASFAARLGPTRFIGCVGDDHLGRSLVADLESDGVEVCVQRRGDTGTIVVLIDRSGERTMLPQRAACTLLDNVPEAWLDGLDLLHVPAYTFDGRPVGQTAVDVVRRAKRHGAMISIDASSTGMLARFGLPAFFELLRDLNPDFLIANEDEAEFLGLSKAGEPGRNLVLLPDTVVVAKAGPDPTTVHQPGAGRFTVPVPAVTDIRDLTGAGDAFAAGFLSAFLKSKDLHSACVGGHEAAARVLASPGASLKATS
ncbi:carbohydrate kinase family protein [Streptomyces cavernicola]|uniref:Adenosine kinase n=1 Tax=Streptomyces cavernicola TaxID=3043613 RepID=A0ABT6S5P9_9ACTN|nr:adenosine kinase [Streptomyces sp. B-S-A6]MDI3403372.1 adenosine kinase [Streptomyces sp. B-S-A6]